MPATAHHPEPAAGAPGAEQGLVVPRRAGPGGPSRTDVRAGRWRRTSRGLYVPADTPATPAQRVLEAAVVLPPHGAVTGWAALCWRGARWFAGRRADGGLRPVVLAMAPHAIRAQSGIAVCEERCDPREIEVVDGVRVVTAVRAVAFEMRYAAHRDAAVEALDMGCYDDLVSIAETREWVMAHPGWTGIGQARDALELADENSWSPMETRRRLAWVDAGRPRPECNRPIFDLEGRHLCTPDLLDPEAGVVAEYDGATHLSAVGSRRDRVRDDRYEELVIEAVVTRAGERGRPESFEQRLGAAYDRAVGHDGPRTWTTTLPPGWVDTSSVARRRALDEAQRAV